MGPQGSQTHLQTCHICLPSAADVAAHVVLTGVRSHGLSHAPPHQSGRPQSVEKPPPHQPHTRPQQQTVTLPTFERGPQSEAHPTSVWQSAAHKQPSCHANWQQQQTHTQSPQHAQTSQFSAASQWQVSQPATKHIQAPRNQQAKAQHDIPSTEQYHQPAM